MPAPLAKRSRFERQEAFVIAARKALDDSTAAEHWRRTGSRIERLVGLLARRSGARQSCYIGAPKARLQARWSAALVNLNPLPTRREDGMTNTNDDSKAVPPMPHRLDHPNRGGPQHLLSLRSPRMAAPCSNRALGRFEHGSASDVRGGERGESGPA
jgi:hypothetical protein